MAGPHVRVWIVPVAAMVLRSLPAAAQAPALQVSPVMVHMSAGEMATTLSVTNAGDSDTTVQLRSFLWRQNEGADALAPTDDLEVSPPITDIPAGLTQVFRLVLRHPAGAAEETYRVLLDQLPAAAQPGVVRIALRISVPVFAASPGATPADVVWQLAMQGRQEVLLGTNRGQQHARVLNLMLRDRGRVPTAAHPRNGPYILPGGTQTWLVDDASRIASGYPVRLTAQSDAGKLDTTVNAAGR